ncbi:hypothetical protein K4L44_05930 [Halosquirtibacter laminarini]|uniref:Uncharacterized protein n=1 Tax=Halosquirtibacter laminarini TaxID=3374600 RepID=A0AC61NI75_9BACT|nr:hypothetical protein K4L44_05930 [Prolixibacteraceae bacterium]
MKHTYQNIIISQILSKAEEERPTKTIEISVKDKMPEQSNWEKLLQRLHLQEAPKETFSSRTYSRLANHWTFDAIGYHFACLCQTHNNNTYFNVNIFFKGLLSCSFSVDLIDSTQEIQVNFIDHFEVLEDLGISFGAEAKKRKVERILCKYISDYKRESNPKLSQLI